MSPFKFQARDVLRSYALSLAVLMPLSVLVGSQAYIVNRREGLHVVLSQILLAYAARYLAVTVLTPPVFYIVSQLPLRRAAPQRIVAYILGYFAFSCGFGLFRWLLLPPWDEDRLTFGPRTLAALADLSFSTFGDVLLLYLGIVALAHAYTYLVRGRRQEIERLDLSRSLAQSELQALRAQLHPHFLFNTLQGIAVLIEADPSRAREMVILLGSLLRTVMSHGATDLIALHDEMVFIKAYVGLERMRLGSRLDDRWSIEPQSLPALIPQLLLQPLIENAIVHGAASATEGGWIELRTWLEGDRLCIRITNSVAESSPRGIGLGLANTRARLRYLYSDDAQLDFALDPKSGNAVTFVAVPAFRGSVTQPETTSPSAAVARSSSSPEVSASQ